MDYIAELFLTFLTNYRKYGLIFTAFACLSLIVSVISDPAFSFLTWQLYVLVPILILTTAYFSINKTTGRAAGPGPSPGKPPRGSLLKDTVDLMSVLLLLLAVVWYVSLEVYMTIAFIASIAASYGAFSDVRSPISLIATVALVVVIAILFSDRKKR